MQRAHYYQKVDDEALVAELAGSEVYSTPGIDAYGLFQANGEHLTGDLLKLRANLPDDGRVHYLERGLSIALPNEETRSSYALRLDRADGRILILARDGGSISAVAGIIGQAVFWGLSLTLVPGLIGWRLLRRRPIRRVERLQRSTERIVSGNLRERLPLSARRDELDMLAVRVKIDHPLVAPLAMGTIVGSLDIYDGEEKLTTRPLISLEEALAGGWWKRAWDALHLFFLNMLGSDNSTYK